MANFTPQQIEEFLREFFDVVGTRQYVGARYVPLFGRKGEESIEWDDAAPYEPLTIVTHEGDTYTSRQFVPAGVDISDADYWAKTGNFNSQVEQYRQEVLRFDGRITNLEDSLPAADFSADTTVKDYIDESSANVLRTAVNNEQRIEDLMPSTEFSNENTIKDYIDESVAGVAGSLGTSKVPWPVSPEARLGTYEQVLATLGNGNTRWVDPVTVTPEVAGPVIASWLDAHPEATTTIEDGAVSTRKLADGAVTNVKLAPNELLGEFNESTPILHYYSDALDYDGFGFLQENGDVRTTSAGWRISDPIDVDESLWGKRVVVRSWGQNYNGVVVSTAVCYDAGPKALSLLHTPTTVTGSAGGVFVGSIVIPPMTRTIRFCCSVLGLSPNTDVFEAFIANDQTNLLSAEAGMIKGNLYLNAEEMLPVTGNGYLDASGQFVANPAGGTWRTSDFIDVSRFNTVYYRCYAAPGSSPICAYDDTYGVVRFVPPASSLQVVSGELDISEATYIRVCQRTVRVGFDPEFDERAGYFICATRSYLPVRERKLPQLMHNVDRPFSFSGKVACFCGDSITYGYTSGGTTTVNGYPKRFSDSVGMTFTNSAVGGATIARVSGFDCIQDQVADALLVSPAYDFLFVAGGVNDWQLGVSLADFRSAMGALCASISAASFTGKVIVIAPISEGGWEPIRPTVADLDEYRQIVMELATQYQFSFLNGNLFDFPTVDSSSSFKAAMFGDLLHPTELGYQLYARGMRTALC